MFLVLLCIVPCQKLDAQISHRLIAFIMNSINKLIHFLFQVEALAVKLTQNEGELIQEKFEVKKLVNFLKQVSNMLPFNGSLCIMACIHLKH